MRSGGRTLWIAVVAVVVAAAALPLLWFASFLVTEIVRGWRDQASIAEQFAKVPSVLQLDLQGDDDNGIRAEFSTPEGGPVVLEGVTADSFLMGTQQLVIARVGELHAYTARCFQRSADEGVWRTMSHSFSPDEECFTSLLARPLDGVPDLVARYAEIRDAFAQIPRCPDVVRTPNPMGPGDVLCCTYPENVLPQEVAPALECPEPEPSEPGLSQ